jgi:hypothetical protein
MVVWPLRLLPQASTGTNGAVIRLVIGTKGGTESVKASVLRVGLAESVVR